MKDSNMNPINDRFAENNDITEVQAHWIKNAKTDSKMNRQFEEAFTKASNEAAARIVADTKGKQLKAAATN